MRRFVHLDLNRQRLGHRCHLCFLIQVEQDECLTLRFFLRQFRLGIEQA